MNNEPSAMNNMQHPWYQFEGVEQLDSPALLLYADRVRANIQKAIALAGSPDRLRPHAKTHKSPEVTRLLLDAGIRQFKCATIAEAELLAAEGAPDVLLAYPLVGPKADRFLELAQAYPQTTFSCLVDDRGVAAQLAQKAAGKGMALAVYVDLNVGMNRTGILPGLAALSFYQYCAALPGLQPVGLHAYDGHIVEPDPGLRDRICREAFAPVFALQEAIVGAGLPEPELVAGGSPTFPQLAAMDGLVCSPGTFVYWDAGYGERFADQPFEPAALVLSRIVSLPDARTLCADLGHKSVAAENPLDRRVRFLNAPGLVPLGQSEEHLVLQAEAGHVFKVGDILYGLPVHICPTCALYERAYVIEDGRVAGEWSTSARARRLVY